jgi:hypothetical protein
MLIAGAEVNVKLLGGFPMLHPLNKIRKRENNLYFLCSKLVSKQMNMLTQEEDYFS